MTDDLNISREPQALSTRSVQPWLPRAVAWGIAGAIVGSLAGAIWTAAAPKTYRAGASLLIERRTAGTEGILGANPNAPDAADVPESTEAKDSNPSTSEISRDIDFDRDVAESQIDVLKSAAVLAPVVADLEPEMLQFFRASGDPIGLLRDRLAAQVGASGGVVRVHLSSRGELAMLGEELPRVLDAVVDSFLSYHDRRNDEAAAAIRNKLAGELEEAQRGLRAIETDLAHHRNSTAPSSDRGRLRERFSTLEGVLVAAEEKLEAARMRYDQSVQRAGVERDALDAAELEAAMVNSESDEDARVGEIDALRRQLDQLAKNYLPNHPSVIRARQRLKQVALADVGFTRLEWQQAGQRVKDLSSQIESVARSVDRADADAREESRLQDEVDRRREVVNSLDRTLREQVARARLGSVAVETLGPASLDVMRDPPTPRMNQLVPVGAGAGAGLGLLMATIGWLASGGGSGWSAGAGSNRAIRSRDVEAMERENLGGKNADGAARVGTQARSAGDLREGRRSGTQQSQDAGRPGDGRGLLEHMKFLGSMPVAAGQSLLEASWSSEVDPAGVTSRATRALRKRIEIGGLLPATLAVVPVESSSEGMVVASNLASLLASEGRRVLLVDAGIDRGVMERVHEVVKGVPGLAEVLSERAEIDTSARSSGVAGLDVMRAGVIGSTEAKPGATGEEAGRGVRDLLDSPRMGLFLTESAARYDHVIFSCPPVESDDDARLVAALTDATIVVARAGVTSRSKVAQARDLLLMLAANVLGLVICDEFAGSDD